MPDLLSPRTMVGQGVLLFAVVWVLAEHSFPSIDDQIKKSFETFDMLCQDGIVRGIIKHRSNVILDEDAEHVTQDFVTHWGVSTTRKYPSRGSNFWQRVLDAVLKDPLFLGTHESQMEMKEEIKRDFNNGTLTDVEVDNALNKTIHLMREKTKDELKKFINYQREKKGM